MCDAVTIADVQFYHYGLPLTEPLSVGTRTLTDRRGLLLCVTDEAGRTGWGEAAPLPGFSSETLDEVTAQARQLRAPLSGLHVPDADLDAVLHAVPTADDRLPSVQFAVESAVVEVLGARRETSAAQVLGGTADTVALNALITAADTDFDAAAKRVRRAGYRAVKLKVGRTDVETDVQRVRQLHAALGNHVGLRLDANRKWDWEEAVAFAEALDTIPIAYIEEPLRAPDRLPDFVAQTRLPVALDETTREQAPEDLPADLSVRAVVLKPTLLGGIEKTRRWAGWARRRNAEPVMSASYESGVGLRMLVALAAAYSDVPAGLSTYARLADDVLRPRLSFDGAEVDVAQLDQSSVDRDLLDVLTPRHWRSS